jgi:transposase
VCRIPRVVGVIKFGMQKVRMNQKPEVYEWFGANRKRVEVNMLPTYSLEYNAVELIWNDTRKHSTHNRYCDTVALIRVGFPCMIPG